MNPLRGGLKDYCGGKKGENLLWNNNSNWVIPLPLSLFLSLRHVFLMLHIPYIDLFFPPFVLYIFTTNEQSLSVVVSVGFNSSSCYCR